MKSAEREIVTGEVVPLVVDVTLPVIACVHCKRAFSYGSVTLNDYDGTTQFTEHVWAAWCPFCGKEQPSTAKEESG